MFAVYGHPQDHPSPICSAASANSTRKTSQPALNRLERGLNRCRRDRSPDLLSDLCDVYSQNVAADAEQFGEGAEQIGEGAEQIGEGAEQIG